MISLSTAKAFLIGFFVAFGWTLGQWMTKTAIIYWVAKIQPVAKAPGILF
jgi:hypothetical protein